MKKNKGMRGRPYRERVAERPMLNIHECRMTNGHKFNGYRLTITCNGNVFTRYYSAVALGSFDTALAQAIDDRDFIYGYLEQKNPDIREAEEALNQRKSIECSDADYVFTCPHCGSHELLAQSAVIKSCPVVLYDGGDAGVQHVAKENALAEIDDSLGHFENYCCARCKYMYRSADEMVMEGALTCKNYPEDVNKLPRYNPDQLKELALDLLNFTSDALAKFFGVSGAHVSLIKAGCNEEVNIAGVPLWGPALRYVEAVRGNLCYLKLHVGNGHGTWFIKVFINNELITIDEITQIITSIKNS